MTTPPLTIAYRSVISGISALIILLVLAGLVGYGPLTVLHHIAAPVSNALHLDRVSG